MEHPNNALLFATVILLLLTITSVLFLVFSAGKKVAKPVEYTNAFRNKRAADKARDEFQKLKIEQAELQIERSDYVPKISNSKAAKVYFNTSKQIEKDGSKIAV